MFRTFPLPIIRSFLLYIRHWHISCRSDDSFQAGSGRKEICYDARSPESKSSARVSQSLRPSNHYHMIAVAM